MHIILHIIGWAVDTGNHLHMKYSIVINCD